MTLVCDGSLSRYSAQALCLLFFPGEKFPEEGGGEPMVEMSTETVDGEVLGRVIIKENGKTVEKTYIPSKQTADRVTPKMLRNLAVGGAMYKAGCEFCGTCPPWGIMTGVRPAKTSWEILSSGVGEEGAVETLCTDYLMSEEKARLATLCAVREGVFITDSARRECSVYIAIPFCPTKCTYCSFTSFASPRLLSLIPAYLERLLVDIENTFALIREVGLKVSTVYIGGGTPTTLSAVQLEILLRKIGSCIDVSSLSEFTLEAGRPDTIDADKMRIAKELGVTRVSVNAQTMNGEILKSIGRAHSPEDFLHAYDIARESGIRDINVDLIAGLPGESAESFAYSCDKIISLDPTNITVHTFYVKRAAEILKSQSSVYRVKDMEAERAVNYSQTALTKAGYLPYYLYRQKNTTANLENAGFAKIGHECLYNIFMMEEVHTVFGIGASAMTKLVCPYVGDMKIERICETKYPYEYLDPAKNTPEMRIDLLRKKTLDFYFSLRGTDKL